VSHLAKIGFECDDGNITNNNLIMEKIINITVDPAVRFGKPCIRGTRIAVADIINLLAAGFTVDEIPAEYSSITKDDVLAALEYTGRMMNKPEHITEIFLDKVKTVN